ncbi:SDR family NAD(P)-dependent oxidoreductase [Actinoplanes sp. NPDC049548]|uniref:SDR family NAD(P)-dependent oxidoreductase n=1 Tax=Actinoplanes sp. NPDC049548 TaxID=3155152 RepID=UPI0034342D85
MDADELELALRVLDEIRARPMDDPDRRRVQRAVDGLLKDAQRQRRADRRRATAAADRATVAGTATGAASRAEGVPVAPAAQPGGGNTRRERRCHTCRGRFRTVDTFYHALCPDCAELHRAQRDARTDLRGRRAVVTGGRVKIGYQVALKLLRDGAAVTVVTRFPADAARRYAAEPDAAEWLPSLRVIGADLRDPRQVLALADRLAEGGTRLDVLVNNAAQTVRRPAWAYQPLVAAEVLAAAEGRAVESVPGYRPGAAPPEWSAALDHVGHEPAALTDATGALVVPGSHNSWTARIGEVDPVELLEVQLVNVVAPFLLLDRLRPVLTGPGTGNRYVVNVTGREGWFGGGMAPERHPHTSVSKAALNMLTRVAAPDLARDGVFMCGVDTGWITDENPPERKARRAAAGWRPPLDVVDAAARIYHPVVAGEAGAPLHGVLLKNYAVVPW